MLFYLSQKILLLAKGMPFGELLSPFRLFGYIAFRTAGAAVTALALSWWLGPRLIQWLK
jgi:phospho-N-acetylmuramoyl-pentapeptide-transferase